MKKLLIHCKRCSVLLLALTAAFAVGCTGDLEDDIADLNGQYEDLNDQVGDLQSQVDALEDKLADNIFIKSIDGTVITFSDNTTLDVEDLLIVTENDEFYVLEVNGEYIVAYKDGVVFPSDVSLPNTSLIDLTLVRGQEYSFYVQIDPTDVTIEPSNIYLVSFIDNLVPDTKADDSDETAGFTIHGDDVVMRAQATSIVRDETKDGRYIATAVWTEGDYTVTDFAKWKTDVAEGGDLYVSVEYPVYTWDEDTASAVRGYKWILSDDTTKYTESYVPVVQSDIATGEIKLHFTEGDSFTTKAPYVLNVEDYIVSDFISGNLTNVFVIDASKDYSTSSISELYEIYNAFDGSGDEIYTWTTFGDYVNKTGAAATTSFVMDVTEMSSYGMTQQSKAVYSCDNCDDEIIRPIMFKGYLAFVDQGYETGFVHTSYPVYTTIGSSEGDADYIVTVDEDGKSLYDGGEVDDDVIEVLKDSDKNTIYYTDITLTTYSAYITTGKDDDTTALFTESTFSGVTRPLTIYVHDIDTIRMRENVTALVPNTADGAVATLSYDSADKDKSETSTAVYSTTKAFQNYGYRLHSYTPDGFHGEIDDFDVTYSAGSTEIVYTPNAAVYGYVYDNLDKDDYNDYLNLDSTTELFVTTSVSANSHHVAAADVKCDITLANTASQALLPGEYWVYASVDMTYTDEDGEVVYVGSKVFAQYFTIYAPQYTMELQPQIRIDAPYRLQGNTSAENYFNTEATVASGTNKGLKYFTTYEWYDFDFARFVDVTTVDGWVNSKSKLSTNYAYLMIDGATTSTVYTDLELALYDYNTAAEYLGLRYSKENASTELVGSTVKWYPGLYVDIDGVESENLIEVDALAAGSKDVSKKVTFYVKLASGLKVPVQIVEYDPEGAYETNAQGASTDKPVLTAADAGTMVFNININGLAANLDADDKATAYEDAMMVFDWSNYNEESGDEFPRDVILPDGDFDTWTYDYSDALSDNEDRYQVHVFTGADIVREVPTYLNLLKDTFHATPDSPRPLNTTVDMFTDIVNFYNRDYSEEVTTELTTACVDYVIAALATAGSDITAEMVQAYPELYATYIAAYEERYDVSAYTTSTNHMRAGIIESQIGDGSSDRSGTVDLIASITFEAGELLDSDGKELDKDDAAYGLKVITIDADGYISPITSVTLPTKVIYTVMVTATITDVAGNVVTAEQLMRVQY